MDPGEVLVAAGDRPADAELERGHQLTEQAALAVEHLAAADDHQAHALGVDLVCRLLPGDDHVGVEALAAGAVGLGDDVVTAVAVVADGGLADEDARLALQAGDRADQVVGAGAAGLEDLLLRLRAPALVDLLAEQVDDAVDPLEGCRRRAFECRLPGVPCDPWVGGTRRAGPAAEADHFVAAGEQRVTQRRADQAAGSGDEDLHCRRPAPAITSRP